MGSKGAHPSPPRAGPLAGSACTLTRSVHHEHLKFKIEHFFENENFQN
jgi:hypothetical protein